MATAFSSSLFGLAGSLVLGFLDLQLGQAMGRFFNELEDWLSAFAKFNEGGARTDSVSSGALASGMSEEAARALLSLSHSIAAGEDSRAQTLAQMNSMNIALASLNEAMADDRRLRDQLAQLNANILQLSADLQRDRTQQTSIVASELRALSSSIAKLISEKSHRGRCHAHQRIPDRWHWHALAVTAAVRVIPGQDLWMRWPRC